ncbi:hypothetical protein Cgig2_002806 [Carnegiea gigantea]|uniref:Haloacid dehalogenase-like hydrolase domain-containing protein n=1 Tax=Carnegiea gigantea TaxID=171969 RepID=A0A9Q1KN94_9CARY|nr:hypothetical protein Cgig2_002806 [Carnegiea gigantea]
MPLLSTSCTPTVARLQHHHHLRHLSPPPPPPPLFASSSAFFSPSHSLSSGALRLCPLRPTASKRKPSSVLTVSASLQALIFDCDGVILESEHLHRQAYNDAFAHFNVRCPSSSSPGPLNWDSEFYDELQNRIGGGKPKMRWIGYWHARLKRYFKEHGWPTSTIFETPPESEADRAKLIDILQVQPRPGVLRLMDEAKAAGKKLAICSAATKSSVVLTLETYYLDRLTNMSPQQDRFRSLDCFLADSQAPFTSIAGDDVKEKKPDPSIYIAAAKIINPVAFQILQRLGVSETDSLVVEDSVIGLQAATQAGMPCIISYTSSTANQDFSAAIATYPDLSSVRLSDLELLLQNAVAAS